MWLFLLFALSITEKGKMDFLDPNSKILYFSVVSFKKMMEKQVKENGICFSKNDQKKYSASQFLSIRKIHSKTLFGMPHGRANLLLEDGREAQAYFYVGQIKGLLLVFQEQDLVEVSFWKNDHPKHTWNFDDGDLKVFSYENSERESLKILQHQEHLFVVGKCSSCHFYTSVKVQKRELLDWLPVPRLEIKEHKGRNLRKLPSSNDDNVSF